MTSSLCLGSVISHTHCACADAGEAEGSPGSGLFCATRRQCGHSDRAQHWRQNGVSQSAWPDCCNGQSRAVSAPASICRYDSLLVITAKGEHLPQPGPIMLPASDSENYQPSAAMARAGLICPCSTWKLSTFGELHVDLPMFLYRHRHSPETASGIFVCGVSFV